jgi:peroxiredoxin
LLVFVVAILLQSVSQVAMEYAVIVLPIVAFPLGTWMRIRAGSSPWFAFFAVNVWLVAADAALGRMAMAKITALVLPMTIALAGSAAVALLSSRSGLGSIAIAAAVGILLVPQTWDAALSSSVGSPAPNVTLQLLNGGRVRLADLRGRVVVLNFWGVWCAPCVRELPELAAFAEHSRTAEVIAVNSGIGGDSPGEIVRFLRARHLNVPVAFDANRIAYRAFGVAGVPTTVIIDPHGMVRERRVGFAATANLESWLVRETARAGRS